jgi:hypothetical protein
MAETRRSRIRMPLGLLDEPLPRFEREDIDLTRKLSLVDRRAPFELLYQTLSRAGYDVADFAPDDCDRYVCWTAKQLPEAARDRSLVLEVAWIPRWAYQASPTGSNGQGHYASRYEYAALSDADLAATRRHLALLRDLYSRTIDPDAVARLRDRLPGPFFLFAFQLANDHNLRYSDTSFSRFCSPTPERNLELAQACIDAVDAVSSPLPVVYKQHPFDPSSGFSTTLHSRGIVIDNADGLSTHEIFATGLCRGVISINSNSVHDAAVWDVPSLCLGTLIWNRGTQRPPFPTSLDNLDRLAAQRPSETPDTLSYLHYLMRHQWTLTDFQNTLMVERLIETRGLCEPMALRRESGMLA